MSQVETVARALWFEAGCPGTYDTGMEGGREKFRALAVAAMKAALALTPAMEAALEAFLAPGTADASVIWRVVIDAALREPITKDTLAAYEAKVGA